MTAGRTKLALLLAMLLSQQVRAATTVLPLSPATSRIEYTVFAFGMVPMTAHFEDFAGSLAIDPPSTRTCRVEVQVRISSLRMADPLRTRLALGQPMLDAAHFPSMGFIGQCAGQTLNGALTLHGITHPLTLALQLQGGLVIATAILQRRDYGILGLAGLVGQRIRIRLQTPLPPFLAQAP